MFDLWRGRPVEGPYEEHHKLNLILERLRNMSLEMDNLTTQVSANSSTIDSAVTLINGISDRITAAGVDPVKLNALASELKTKNDVLAAAVVANTPVEVTAPVTVVAPTPVTT
jgi:hypothetical protein